MASSTNKQTVEDAVVQQLNELFGNVLNLDIIKTVANSCQYDVTKSSNKLLEITSYSNEKAFINKLENITGRNNTGDGAVLISPSKLNNVFELSEQSQKSCDINRIISSIRKGYKVLVLMRGLPGSGKSTLAKEILELTIGCGENHSMHILSTDDYFYQNKQALYLYDVAKIGEAHNWNQSRAFQSMSRGFSPVIIDNTNVKMWEMKPYATMATDYGYIIEILEPNTPWCFNEKELSKRNRHFVPKEKIRNMILNYERNITSRKLLNDYNIVYKLQKPPQMRLHPPMNLLITPIVPSNYSLNNEDNASTTNMPCTKKSPVETVNLIQLDDMSSLPKKKKNVNNLFQDVNSIDNILMYTNSTNENILEPQKTDSANIIVIDSSDDEDISVSTFSDIEKAWGINEKSLRSWDIVTPLPEEHTVCSSKNIFKESKIDTTDKCCITEEKYFRLLKDHNTDTESIGICILPTVNRDINRFYQKQDISVFKKFNKTLLDKSCMTEDVYENYDNHMIYLTNMFPDVSRIHLTYLYSKCKGDLEWTIEFLLENEEINLIDVTEDITEEQNVQLNQFGEYPGGGSDSSNEEQKKKRKYRKSSGDHEDLKMLIESKIDINSEHYSKNLLKIKSGSKPVDMYKPSKSSDSSAENNQSKPVDMYIPSQSFDSSAKKNPSCSKALGLVNTNDKIDVDLDMGFDDVDSQCNCNISDLAVEDMIELNLGDNFVMQLEKKFGDPHMSYPKGYQPVVQVPVSLARQLYMFYIESIYQQMDNQMQILETLTKQDEEFARKLQDEENKGASAQIKPINFSEIMEEQMREVINRKELDKWKNLNPDNLAAKLTREKLFSVFPTIERDTLVEILYAHNNNYKTTIESLLASTGANNLGDNLENIKQPPISEDVILEMKDAQEKNSIEEYEDLHEATYYRDEASKFLKRRDELYNKAQLYHQKGMREVAQFYSGLASKQTVYFEKANSLAVTAFLDEHSKRLQDFNTLDLHFLYVKEAMIALDVFLDTNINLLRLSTIKFSEYLQIITGRGKRSEKGIARIRPAVEARLKTRKTMFVQMNPGLLKVKIIKQSPLTSEIPQCSSI